MSGLDKIIGHIREEAQSEADAILTAAKEQAETITADASRKASDECDRIQKKTESEVRSIRERGQSSAELRKKQILLAEKQKLITEVIQKAQESLYQLPRDQYFDLLTKLFAKNILAKEGTISFNQKDLKELPEGICETLSRLAQEKGGSITLSEKPAEIDGGFLLDYGGIEENCSFQALIDGSTELLQDKVQKLLFA